MAVEIRKSSMRPGRVGHVKPRRPILDLNQDGRLRSAHVLALFGISHSTLYARMEAGKLPRPDGNDGTNYWHTSTIRPLVGGGGSNT